MTSVNNKTLVVIGSLNVDLVMRTDRIPKAGETFYGNSFSTGCGGKGANQAIACARLSSQENVKMIGCVGDDEFGSKLIENLKRESIDTSEVIVQQDISTGVALIMVEEVSGQNRICLSKGANGTFQPSILTKHASSIEEAAMVIMQLEVPLETVTQAVALAKASNVPVLLNPAPARELPVEMYSSIDYIVPNETEAEILTGIKLESIDDAKKAGLKLLEWGVKRAVVITMGAIGVVLVTKTESLLLDPVQVDRVIDTTGAGDCFIGGMATKLVEGVSLVDAINFGQHASSIAITRHGAQESIPYRVEIEA